MLSQQHSRCDGGWKKSRDGSERLRLVFVDECAIHTHPGLAKIWQRRGQPMRIPAAGEDRPCTVFGGVDYASGQVLWQMGPQKSGEAFARFLDLLATTFPEETIIVVLDNASYHKSQEVREHWRRLAPRITPYWLPVYASQLNLIERRWRWLKANLAGHRWWQDMARLQTAAATLLNALTGAISCRSWSFFSVRVIIFAVPLTLMKLLNALEVMRELYYQRILTKREMREVNYTIAGVVFSSKIQKLLKYVEDTIGYDEINADIYKALKRYTRERYPDKVIDKIALRSQAYTKLHKTDNKK